MHKSLKPPGLHRRPGGKYAHGEEELRPAPDAVLTRLCENMLRTRACARGAACRYPHMQPTQASPGPINLATPKRHCRGRRISKAGNIMCRRRCSLMQYRVPQPCMANRIALACSQALPAKGGKIMLTKLLEIEDFSTTSSIAPANISELIAVACGSAY